jgi:hypothetical protein
MTIEFLHPTGKASPSRRNSNCQPDAARGAEPALPFRRPSRARLADCWRLGSKPQTDSELEISHASERSPGGPRIGGRDDPEVFDPVG